MGEKVTSYLGVKAGEAMRMVIYFKVEWNEETPIAAHPQPEPFLPWVRIIISGLRK